MVPVFRPSKLSVTKGKNGSSGDSKERTIMELFSAFKEDLRA
jgi:hypothetical protein